MNILKIAGKFLDQPLLVAKFQKSVPAILLTSSGLYGIRRIKREPEKNRNSAAARIATTIMFTAASALAAPIITNKLFKKAPVSIKRIKESNSSLVNVDGVVIVVTRLPTVVEAVAPPKLKLIAELV